mmetsp:Transcript_5048/g.4416  ORF Transcript_5048/g.4416 Transcript_5048/m.4416 type:complete len:298 (+) Transcript_5048:126-1019(+)
MASPYDEDDDAAPLAGNNSAYDDNPGNDNNQMGQALEMGAVGAQQMGGQVANAYDEETANQKDEHEAPPPPSYMVNLCNWFPLRLFCFAGGAGLVACTILDFIFNGDSFIQWIIRVYLLFFGLVTMMIESPTWTCTRWFQTRIYFWFRILSRMWGRAWFYLFITILCFGEFDQEDPAEFTIVAGFYLIFIAILSFIFSRLSAKKLNRMYEFVAAGTENDEMEGRFIKKYDVLVSVNTEGKMGSMEITKLAKDAGRGLANSERHAIQTYLDESCLGYVTKEDFMKQFLRLKEEKMRFL